MKELYFIRHGQTQWNAIRRMQGQWNSDLSDLGREQAAVNGQFLSGVGIDYMVASPLDRTQQTATIIGRALSLDYSLDDRLKEWDCGDWSGEMYAEISQRWPQEYADWQAEPFDYRGPNAENYPDMIARAKPFLAQLMATQFERIAIVSHGMIGRAMVGTLLAMSPQEMLGFSQTNDTIFHLTEGDGHFRAAHYVGGVGPHPGLPGARSQR